MDHWETPPKDKEQLKAALTLGPVGISVAADANVFRSYKSGTINWQSCGSQVGHAVLAIGYGIDENGEEYVTIKNSWGKSWGESGFGRISMSTRYDHAGICGCLTEGTWAEVMPPKY
jgi:C1A family cysteine protease